MSRTIAAVLALLVFPASANAQRSDAMTLAEANRLSPSQLAERLLGAAGASGSYVEANIQGDGGIMTHQRGLTGVDLYQRPRSAGFAGLCEVDGIHLSFDSSPFDTPGDPPHRVHDFWKFKRFAILVPSAARIDETDWKREGRQCADLTPGANRSEPGFFAALSDKPVDAYFAMRAVAKAQSATLTLGTSLTCMSNDKDWPICTDPVAAMVDIPIRQIGPVDVRRCDDGRGWCVTTGWTKSRNANESREIELMIRTDAMQVDPPVDFRIVSVAVKAGTSIDD